jgi:hypothetical protein
MKILIACEYSGVLRDAFTRAGFDATSCDILPTESPDGVVVKKFTSIEIQNK